MPGLRPAKAFPPETRNKWLSMAAVLVAMIRADAIQVIPEIIAIIAGSDEFKGAWRAPGQPGRDPVGQSRYIKTSHFNPVSSYLIECDGNSLMTSD
jgi:hypothetical protein